MAKDKKASKLKKRFLDKNLHDPVEVEAYEKARVEKLEKRLANSKFKYPSAGGEYIPSKSQYLFAKKRIKKLTQEQRDAMKAVREGYSKKEMVNHDYIHIVNNLIRKYKKRKNERKHCS